MAPGRLTLTEDNGRRTGERKGNAVRLLIVEDEADMQEALCYGLRKRGYAVDAAGDGLTAVELCEINEYDLVVLDLNLPGLDGLDVLRHIRSQGRAGKVLILSARAAIDDKITGLDEGASDYLTKPFHFGELEARIRALLRPAATQPETVLTQGGLRLDTRTKTAQYGGEPLRLSMREFAILEYLVLNAGRPVSAEELLEHVWDSAADPFTNQIKVYISIIRRKLSAVTDTLVIQSIRGAGYIIHEEARPC